ncbi:MAG: glycosyltransferase [Planctomycetota bacterium]
MPANVAYSIIVPAYNEADELPRTLRTLRRAMAAVAQPGELVVVDNNSTDATAAIARAQADRVVFEPHNQIGRARNAGARVARGRYLVFVDADTLIPPALLRRALARLERGDCSGGGAQVAFCGHQHPFYRWVLGTWNRVSRLFGLAAGCFVFCHRRAFQAVGGFDEALYAGEELRLSRRIAAWGRRRAMRFQILRGPPVVTSDRKLHWFGWRDFSLFILGSLLLGPLFMRFRRACFLWYRRPAAGEAQSHGG